MGIAPTPGRERPLVFVVADDREISRFVCETLDQEYRTQNTTGGEEGVDRAVALLPDLLIGDVAGQSPEGSNLVEVVRGRPELDHVPVVVLAARQDRDACHRWLRKGAQDYLLKPLSAVELSSRAGTQITLKRAREVLVEQAGDQGHVTDLEEVARGVAERTRSLEAALLAALSRSEQAERSSELKTHFLAMVSHELRTPITAIQMQLRRLAGANGNGLDDGQRALVGRMRRSAGRLTDLVESLLDYAALQSGCLATRALDLDLAKLASEAVDDARWDADQKGLKLHLSIQSPMPPLHSDERVVRLVLSNLINNAVKFTERGYVDVSVSAEGAIHRVRVSDTGPGIARAEQARIFQRFERIEPPSGKHTPGVGLGLAMVRDLVGALGGQVALESDSGRGSTFIVDLPRLS